MELGNCIILHGDNTASSRRKLGDLLDSARHQGCHVLRLVAKKINPADLEDALSSQDLFGQPKVIVIEELHSLPTSARKKSLLESLATHSHQLTSQTGLILWEKRSLTATMIKKFAPAQALDFPLSKSMFKWLDSLRGHANPTQQVTMIKLLHQTIDQDGDFFALSMLVRQMRMLMEVLETGQVAGPPFMLAKLRSQAASFSLSQLIQTHRQLLEIDLKMKTSTTSLTLVQELDLLLLTL